MQKSPALKISAGLLVAFPRLFSSFYTWSKFALNRHFELSILLCFGSRGSRKIPGPEPRTEKAPRSENSARL